jgi:hypothetical protein
MCVSVYTCVCMCVHLHLCVCVYVCTCVCTYVCECVCAHIYICVHLYTCAYVCMRVCVCVNSVQLVVFSDRCSVWILNAVIVMCTADVHSFIDSYHLYSICLICLCVCVCVCVRLLLGATTGVASGSAIIPYRLGAVRGEMAHTVRLRAR